MSEWQPIATAPHDRRILVCTGNADLKDFVGGVDLVEIVQFIEADWMPRKCGWNNGDWTYDLYYFDWWMPMPEPPRTEAAARTEP
jgi:hypothetical protein